MLRVWGFGGTGGGDRLGRAGGRHGEEEMVHVKQRRSSMAKKNGEEFPVVCFQRKMKCTCQYVNV